MGWTVYVKNSVSYAAMTEETSALAYKIIWELNRPARGELLINDDSGAKTQTYGPAYMGTSAILIQQPAATEIFRGRIVAAEPLVTNNLLRIRFEDWLGQLDDRLIIYDTREDLGNGIRETQVEPYRNAGTRCNAYVTAGGPFMMVEHGDMGEWVDDAWDGMKLLFPYRYLGKQTDKLYAYDETVTVIAGGAATTDDPAAGESKTWAADDDPHTVSETNAGAAPDFYINYDFHTFTIDSGLVDSIDAVRVTVTWKLYGANLKRAYLSLYDYNIADFNVKLYESGVNNTLDAMTEYETRTFTVPGSNIADVIDADGDMQIQIGLDTDVNGTHSVMIDELYIEIDYTVDTALSAGFTISDTDGEAGYNYLTLATDPRTAGCVDWWYFHISDKVTAYVADLVGTYDELYALDSSSDVTASTTYVGRHYHRVSPLTILRDLANVDGTDFWLNPWDGDSLDLVWNSTYAVAGAPNWTDSSVLTWLEPRQALADVTNEWFGEGYTSGDYKVTGSDTDAGSITAYGRRSGFFNNPDIGSDLDCAAECGVLVDRTKDLPFHLSCLMNGYNTTTLGTVIEVDSTKLGLADAYYIVTRKEYDSRSGLTTFHLTPRDGTNYTLNPVQHIDTFGLNVLKRLRALESTQERGTRYTDTWS